MLIKTRYPDHCHGYDFLCFNFMNYYGFLETPFTRAGAKKSMAKKFDKQPV